MRRALTRMALILTASTCLGTSAVAQEPAFDRKEDVIYGRKFGTALTMDVFTPKKNANGHRRRSWSSAAGSSRRTRRSIRPSSGRFLDRGYTVFAVVHGSQPRYTVPEIVQDMNRAVRFIRHHAKDYGIDPDRIGVYGGSAGGHLSLMQGTAGDAGNPKAKDPVDRESSRVQAVACFFPPTDFLNYGKPGKGMIHATDISRLPGRRSTSTSSTRQTMLWCRSPTRRAAPGDRPADLADHHVTPDDPPTLIIHGDADKLVPIQQSELMVEKLKKAGVEAKLVVKKGAGHGWAGMDKDMAQFADWFDAHLGKPKSGG